ncbi:MAG: hypothetical protein ACTSPL_08430 [Candidatus Odinarchaeia archaeon]
MDPSVNILCTCNKKNVHAGENLTIYAQLTTNSSTEITGQVSGRAIGKGKNLNHVIYNLNSKTVTLREGSEQRVAWTLKIPETEEGEGSFSIVLYFTTEGSMFSYVFYNVFKIRPLKVKAVELKKVRNLLTVQQDRILKFTSRIPEINKEAPSEIASYLMEDEKVGSSQTYNGLMIYRISGIPRFIYVMHGNVVYADEDENLEFEKVLFDHVVRQYFTNTKLEQLIKIWEHNQFLAEKNVHLGAKRLNWGISYKLGKEVLRTFLKVGVKTQVLDVLPGGEDFINNVTDILRKKDCFYKTVLPVAITTLRMLSLKMRKRIIWPEYRHRRAAMKGAGWFSRYLIPDISDLDALKTLKLFVETAALKTAIKKNNRPLGALGCRVLELVNKDLHDKIAEQHANGFESVKDLSTASKILESNIRENAVEMLQDVIVGDLFESASVTMSEHKLSFKALIGMNVDKHEIQNASMIIHGELLSMLANEIIQIYHDFCNSRITKEALYRLFYLRRLYWMNLHEHGLVMEIKKPYITAHSIRQDAMLMMIILADYSIRLFGYKRNMKRRRRIKAIYDNLKIENPERKYLKPGEKITAEYIIRNTSTDNIQFDVEIELPGTNWALLHPKGSFKGKTYIVEGNEVSSNSKLDFKMQLRVPSKISDKECSVTLHVIPSEYTLEAEDYHFIMNSELTALTQ